MAKELVLEEMVENRQPTPLCRLSASQTVIGREPDNGIAISHGAISREHGEFLKIRNHWFYRDLGSTNGSWINGAPVPADQWRLVRPNDYLQFADLAVRVREEDPVGSPPTLAPLSGNSGRSLIIFSEGNFIDEFPIPEFGRALVVGGSQADLDIKGDIYENPSLVVERRGDRVCAFSVQKEYPLFLNDEEIFDTRNVKDRDVMSVAEFVILYNDPPPLSVNPNLSGRFEPGTNLKSWGADQGPDLVGGESGQAPSQKTSVKTQFGRAPEEDDYYGDELAETVAMDPSQVSAQLGLPPDRHPSSRYQYDESTHYSSVTSSEDKLIIFVGLIAFLILIALVVWWMFV
ncbi:MAG: FHA domain-containing protein [Bdellovibrionales bacterium]|nr:FHA domain-containing protein [Bdellovibrionales bacterium]